MKKVYFLNRVNIPVHKLKSNNYKKTSKLNEADIIVYDYRLFEERMLTHKTTKDYVSLQRSIDDSYSTEYIDSRELEIQCVKANKEKAIDNVNFYNSLAPQSFSYEIYEQLKSMDQINNHRIFMQILYNIDWRGHEILLYDLLGSARNNIFRVYNSEIQAEKNRIDYKCFFSNNPIVNTKHHLLCFNFNILTFLKDIDVSKEDLTLYLKMNKEKIIDALLSFNIETVEHLKTTFIIKTKSKNYQCLIESNEITIQE